MTTASKNQVTVTLVSTTQGRVLNLSIAGMAIETQDRLNVGQAYRIGSPMNQDGRVVWCHFRPRNHDGESEAPGFQAGVEFSASLSENATQILDFIDRVGSAGASRRVFGRFDIGNAEVEVVGRHAADVTAIEGDTVTVESDLLPSLETIFRIEAAGLDGALDCVVVGIHPLSSGETPSPRTRLRLRVAEADVARAATLAPA